MDNEKQMPGSGEIKIGTYVGRSGAPRHAMFNPDTKVWHDRDTELPLDQAQIESLKGVRVYDPEEVAKTPEAKLRAHVRDLIVSIKEAPVGQLTFSFTRQEMEMVILPALEALPGD
jgi:hypothetical protein